MKTSLKTSLKDLIRLAFSEPILWLAGQAYAHLPVNWVVDDLEQVQAGDIFLLPAVRFGQDVLNAAYQKQALAVILLGKPPEEMPACPDGLALLALPELNDLRQAQRLLATVLVNQRAILMERSMRIQTQLAQLAAQGEGLPGLARAVAEISGHGVLIQDKRGWILAEYPSSTLQTIWEDILGQIDLLEGLPDSLLDRKQVAKAPHGVRLALPGGVERLVQPIVVGQMARGYFSLIGIAGEMDALDAIVIEQGSLVCGVEMSRGKAVRETEKRLKGELLEALLQENLSPRDVRLWAQKMGLDLSSAQHEHAALRFAWHSTSPPSLRRLETLVNEKIAQLNLVVLVSVMEAEVVCFCQAPAGGLRPEPALLLAQAVLEQGQREFPQILLLCGVGRGVPDIGAWRDSFRQAGQALEMAQQLHIDKPLFFADLSVYRLLLQIERHSELAAFQAETIGPLLAYEGGAEMLRTLEAFFEHNGNISQTAEALYIHRNTLLYRMERIAGILEIDLERPEARLALQLALHIYRMQGGEEATKDKD